MNKIQKNKKDNIFTDDQAHHIAEQFKEMMENGATVKAKDSSNVLQPLDDGSIYGGLFIDYNAKSKAP